VAARAQKGSFIITDEEVSFLRVRNHPGAFYFEEETYLALCLHSTLSAPRLLAPNCATFSFTPALQNA
jgi:hypothetical protein